MNTTIAELINQDPQPLIQIANSCNETTQLLIKVVALTKLEKYEEALGKCSIQQGSEDSTTTNTIHFIKCYCLYRLNRLEECLAAIEGSEQEDKDASARHLHAQVLYRLERFNESLDIYNSMETDEDVETNKLAVLAAKYACTQENDDEDTAIQNISKDVYPQLFNYAYLLINKIEFDLALSVLDESYEKCSTQMSLDGYEEVDIRKELLLISAQKAFVYQKLGQSLQAQGLYEKVLKQSSISLDPVVLAIATNNLQVLKGADDIVEVSKALKFINTPSVIAKLNSSQKFLVEYNAMIYSMLVGKNSVVSTKLANLFESPLVADEWRLELLTYIQAYLHLKNQNHHHNQNQNHNSAAQLQSMREFVSNKPDSVAANLWLMAILAGQASWNAVEGVASKLLKTAPKFMVPGIVSLLVWVYEKNGKNSQALEVLETYNESIMTEGGDHHQETKRIRMIQLADFKRKLGKYEEAAISYQEIMALPDFKQASDRDQVEAGFLFCLAQTNPSQIQDENQDILKRLRSKVSKRPLTVSLDQLEILPGKKYNNSSRVATTTTTTAAALQQKPTASSEVQVKRKSRKRPIPKDFDASRTPDPERWLPKVQRQVAKLERERKEVQEANKLKKISKEKEVSGMGFQGFEMAGGGVGGTGSSNIKGRR